MAEIIQQIKLKRGLKANLILKLTGENVLLAGEPAFETDTGQLKIGNGVNNYIDLPYVGAADIKIAVTDPEAQQVLLYDAEAKKWVNKTLTDAKSIIYLDTETNKGLSLQGYAEATVGQMLVKDHDNGITWINPVSTETLDEKVQIAARHAATAGAEATKAGNYAADASTSAQTAENINAQTVDYIEKKFWWGTIEEYNALKYIDEGTFYFIKPGQ